METDQKDSKKRFSLTQLLIAFFVGILGVIFVEVLAASLMPGEYFLDAVSGVRNIGASIVTPGKHENLLCRSNLRTLDGAIQMYEAEMQENPSSLEDLVPYMRDRKVPDCPVDKDHSYSMIESADGIPVSAVKCANDGGRDGAEDENHFD